MCRTSLVLAALALGAGCGESFQATAAGGNGGAGGSGAGGVTTTNAGGGTSTTTPSGACDEGESLPCYSGGPGTENVGTCKAGLKKCVDGQWSACEGEVAPASEDDCTTAADDNCDGVTNDGCACDAVGTQVACYDGPAGTEKKGLCQSGQKTCKDDFTYGPCDGQVKPAAEICDGKDNDCNEVDDDVPGAGADCDSGQLGVCNTGVLTCDVGSGAVVCVPAEQASSEICNNEDDNCDGVVDNIALEICEIDVSDNEPCFGLSKCVGGGDDCAPKNHFFDTFSQGVANNWVLDGAWQIAPLPNAPAMPGQGNPDPTEDVSQGGDNMVAGVVVGGNVGVNGIGNTYLTSKAFNTEGPAPLYLAYWRHLNTANGAQSPHTVEVSKNGGASWSVVWSVGDGSIQDSGWTHAVHDISSYKSPNMKIRFGFGVTVVLTQSISSWNIDDVLISSCPAAP